ncbi:MAG: DUF3180 domain-containing protein [Micropruina sp.]|uniref:DUF3180 domain-containing protein n=1 Tax=Micropruina sp. TaxID=2737536 RepID=UPI0039E3B1FA
MPEPRPSVQPTGRTALTVAGVVGAGLAWIALSGVENVGLPTPPVPLLTAVVLAVLAVAAWLAARWMHRTVQLRHQVVEPARAIAMLLAGKAALLGGTALAAGYAVVALRALPNLDAALPRERVLAAGASALLSVVLAFAGRALERACQVPPSDPDDESGDAPGGEPGPRPGAG